MKVRIEFEIESAAFEDNMARELLAVCRVAARKAYVLLNKGRRPLLFLDGETLLDSNGTSIGEVRIVEGQTPSVPALEAKIEELRDTVERVVNACNELCTCGGAGPGEGCLVCELYHKAQLGKEKA